MGYLYLTLAIIAEVIGTTALKASEGFSKPLPSVLVVLGYCAAFYFLSLVLKTIPVGIAYAIWAGMGIVLMAIVGILFFDQTIDFPAVIGLLLIISGVVVINIFSKSVGR
ncbi:SMR family transporter [uncultured Oceanicoccus sp.]|uniref:DMT family transporter n=1 Tax=uncultured Oceanicoccus sp. TaxID=1706381 RepID=UPI0030DAA72D